MTVFVTVWPWPFDLWVNACRATATEYASTKFGINRSSRFPFSNADKQTDGQTDRQINRQPRLNDLPTPAAIQPAWVINVTRYCQRDIDRTYFIAFLQFCSCSNRKINLFRYVRQRAASASNCQQLTCFHFVLTSWRYATLPQYYMLSLCVGLSACLSACPSVCHKPALYQKD